MGKRKDFAAGGVHVTSHEVGERESGPERKVDAFVLCSGSYWLLARRNSPLFLRTAETRMEDENERAIESETTGGVKTIGIWTMGMEEIKMRGE